MIKRGQDKLAHAMLRPINPTMIILLGIFTIVWGFWVGNPFWSVFTHAALFSFMNFMPEYVWGLLAVGVGCIISFGAVRRKPNALMLGARVGGIFWLVVSIMFFLGDWMNTGGITALVLAIYCSFVYVNLKVNHSHVDHSDELFTK